MRRILFALLLMTPLPTYAVSFDQTGGGSSTVSGNIVVDSATVNNLTASRLAQSDSSKALSSVSDLTTWVAGTSNQVTVGNDGDGSVTLSLPQNVHTGASLQIARMGIGMAATSNHLIETNYPQSIASLHNIGVEFHQEGNGTGTREIDAGVFEAVYNQSGGTHSGTLLGLNGVLEVANGTQSAPAYAMWGFGYLGVAAGAAISSNTFLFYGSTLDLGSGGTYAAPVHYFHADPIPETWTGEKVAYYSKGGGTGFGAFVSRGGYAIFNDAQSASTFTVRGASDSNLFVVDGVNSKVGVGTAAPASKLDMAGTLGAWARTSAQLSALAPARAGEMLFCSNCAVPNVYVSTGTGTGAWVSVGDGTTTE